ncbi:hypothetical protein ASG17_06100 [Brevundimonas sp. Leaf363]|uniref:MAPEG family protein n=1 Tax=Brevundimonas sp. Leaf363 TaxID=1736353 RepID=UPI0006FD575A|nr:MAPEG family protein [Brevundimonas sp. Leaf363]KQS55637.1 hypothetical protein ASG17_06100 [Brevundimonas sp. Leaf363]
MTAIQAAALWSGLLIIWITALGVRVTLDRRKHKVLLGDGGVADLNVSVRVFANAAEYMPMGWAALILMALCGAPVWAIHAVGAALLTGRIIHPFGMRATGGVRLPRALGMMLTWLPLLAAGATLVILAFR